MWDNQIRLQQSQNPEKREEFSRISQDQYIAQPTVPQATSFKNIQDIHNMLYKQFTIENQMYNIKLQKYIDLHNWIYKTVARQYISL